MNQAIGIDGGTPINVNDPHVIDIAKFTVNEYNKHSETAKTFEKVLSGVSQTMSYGTIYRFNFSATDGSSFGAIVLENPRHSLKLMHLAPIHG
ncbi:hypothetical protein RYX36_001510 [Vicia faba]